MSELTDRAEELAKTAASAHGQPWPWYKDLKLIGLVVGNVTAAATYLGAALLIAKYPALATVITPEFAFTLVGTSVAQNILQHRADQTSKGK